MRPLALLTKNYSFLWYEEAKIAFEKSRTALCTTHAFALV